MASDDILFSDVFEVSEVNPEGKSSKAFNNVARIFAKGVTFEQDLVLDVQCQLFPLKKQERIEVCIASSLDLPGEKRQEKGVYDQSGIPSLLDKYDYGMYGKVFQYEHNGEHKIALYASFGGLLMKLVGDARTLGTIELDSNIYCLLKRQDKD